MTSFGFRPFLAHFLALHLPSRRRRVACCAPNAVRIGCVSDAEQMPSPRCCAVLCMCRAVHVPVPFGACSGMCRAPRAVPCRGHRNRIQDWPALTACPHFGLFDKSLLKTSYPRMIDQHFGGRFG